MRRSQADSTNRSLVAFGKLQHIRHTTGMKSKVHPTYKTKYRVANWAAYNQALVRRGDVTVWVSAEAIAAWTPGRSGRRGGQRRYSDLAALLHEYPLPVGRRGSHFSGPSAGATLGLIRFGGRFSYAG